MIEMATRGEKNDSVVFDCQSREEAELYVESIMPSQRVTRVATPPRSGRKRNLSLPSEYDTTVKKAKRPDDGDRRVYSSAKRVLGQFDSPIQVAPTAPKPAPRSIVVTEAEVHNDGDPSVKQLIAKMSSDMHMMFTCLTERIEKLESGLEQRIATKVAQLLDKRVNSELGRIKHDIEARLDTFKDTLKEEFGDEIEEIHKKIDTLPAHTAHTEVGKPDLSRNVVIRNLPETVNENISDKVDILIKNGLKVNSVNVAFAERKSAGSSNKPGVVVATFHSAEDKLTVMKNKPKLKGDNMYGNVYINHDMSIDDRRTSYNLRTIVDAVNRGERSLSIQGTRVINSRSRYNYNGPAREANSGPSSSNSDRPWGSRGNNDNRNNYNNNRNGNNNNNGSGNRSNNHNNNNNNNNGNRSNSYNNNNNNSNRGTTRGRGSGRFTSERN